MTTGAAKKLFKKLEELKYVVGRQLCRKEVGSCLLEPGVWLGSCFRCGGKSSSSTAGMRLSVFCEALELCLQSDHVQAG